MQLWPAVVENGVGSGAAVYRLTTSIGPPAHRRFSGGATPDSIFKSVRGSMGNPNDGRTPPASSGWPSDAAWSGAASETADRHTAMTALLRANAANSPTRGQTEIPTVCAAAVRAHRCGPQLRSQSA